MKSGHVNGSKSSCIKVNPNPAEPLTRLKKTKNLLGYCFYQPFGKILYPITNGWYKFNEHYLAESRLS
ncbi:hypothetical protein RCL_jg11953.t1 [Rhizophagus clarus]|uniref:Uncharacterized protein n=1 Tax=Rhizophagus clarus TaxID=94130 RepID=A0A8H3QJF1_9GLOM|nr:hypothetical protein RCL_jg11953.t1 [Rhizophagus clarus]